MTRRQFLSASAASAALSLRAAESWQAGDVAHLLPTASDTRILLKASFRERQARPPQLRVGKRKVAGVRTDTAGVYWRFDVDGLPPGEEYKLELVSAAGKSLCDPWPLKTFPSRDSAPQRFRLLVYTCAGGDERVIHPSGKTSFLPLAVRRRMFSRALSFQPDAAIGNGDHIYWDLRQTGAPPRYAEDLLRTVGRFDRTIPVLGTANEDVLKRVGDAQVGQLYGTSFRSTPVFFLQDDHDYFENDDADDQMVTFPPDHLMVQLGRGVRRLWFPEFLPDPGRPAGLPGASFPDTPGGTGESFGTIRFGRLAEILLFDCRRHLSLAGPNAWIVPPEVEAWLKARMADPAMAHLVNVPSSPPVWTAGKWGDWNPDVLDAENKMTTKIPKPYWQPGWAAQHDRLMAATSAQRGRQPIWISGDMHAHGQAKLQGAGDTDLSANPVNVFLSGAVSTLTGWPSGPRRTPPKVAERIRAETPQPAIEENGFLIVDFEESGVTVRSYKWLPKDGEGAIDTLEPFRTVTLQS